MLHTNLSHILSADEHQKFIEENENVMICCGRMGPMCIPVYGIMEDLEGEYSNIKFADMEFDNPESHVIRSAPECTNFMGLPFTVYYRNGKMVHATSSIQSMEQVKEVLDSKFSVAVEG
jgi:thioredoxin 1